MAYDPSIFNISPYYDDYDPTNRFLRVMFKPGYAIQARELTQLQSILQNQISNISDHLFKDGSRIVGAPISVRNTNFLGLKTGTGTPFVSFATNDWDNLLGGTIYWGATAAGVIAHVMPPKTDDKLFVVVDYVKGYGSQIPIGGTTLGITTASDAGYAPEVVAGATYNGVCKLVTVGSGIFYVDAAFVVNEAQSFTPHVDDGVSRNLSGTVGGVTFAGIDKRVGFSITRDTRTSVEDITLLDPSFGSPNYRAPGADRFIIDLELSQTGLTDKPDDFVELLRFEDGKVTKKVDRIVYGDIAKVLAQRTYDESGSYVVKPFSVSVRQASTESNLDIVIGPGKAYVFGEELETKYPTTITIPKARTTNTETGTFGFNTGNVVGVSLDMGDHGTTAYGYFHILNGGNSDVVFRNSSSTVIGRAKVHGLLPSISGITGSKFNMYLFGVCSGSVIAGASTAVIYATGTIGGIIAGATLGLVYPISGTTFSVVGASASADTCLVYEVFPTQGVSAWTAVSVRGKAVSKTSISGLAVSTSGTGASAVTTYTCEIADLESTIPTASINLIDGLSDTPGTSALATVSKYHLINENGLVFNPANAAVRSVYKSGTSVVLSVTGAPAGFTAPATAMRMVVPYTYTPNTYSSSGSDIKIKTSTAGSINESKTFQTLPGGRVGITLSHWDVYSVSTITINSADALSAFELDDGQREGFYDHSALVVKKSFAGSGSYISGNSVAITASYKYFLHGGAGFAPFIGTHSYIGISYDQIPLFTNPNTGRTVSLANCLDFRHSGPTADTIIAKPYGDYESLLPTTATWSNFLPRIDRLGVRYNPIDSSTTFFVDSGVAEMSPQSPPETENSMTIATLLVPAFTQRPQDVVVNKTDNRRYTMSDINSVESRLDSVEVYAKLSVSESEMSNALIKPLVDSFITSGGSTVELGVSSISAEPVKTSIYADDLYGHAGADVSDVDHLCSVDYDYGEIRALFLHKGLTTSIGLGKTPTLTQTVVSSDGLLTLAYSSTRHLTADGHNKSIPINPTGTVNWLGFMVFTNQYQTNFDSSVRPVVYNNNLSENDNWVASNANNTRGFGTQWNDWEYMWSGTSMRADQSDETLKRLLEAPRTNSPSSIPTVNSGNEHTSVSRSVVPLNRKIGNQISSSRLLGRIKEKTYDNRIIDKTVVPYIPSATIGITAYGMRPLSSGLNLYVDGVLMKSGLTANSNGTVGVTFAFTSEAFLSGEKAVRLTDNSSSQNATQAADGTFYCGASVRQRIDGVYSTRNPEYRRQTVTSEGITKSPFDREVSYDSVTDSIGNNQWIDPICQTFFVDKKQHPEGIFASSVTLYFDGIDSNLPVTVQIRPTINGYPSPSVSLPFSTVTKDASAIANGYVGSTTTPVGCGFTFSSPVYLEPGEYAIAILTNSGGYSLRASDSGVNLDNGGRNNSPLVGTLFQPQSIGAAVQNLSADIAFSVDRCLFSSATGSATYTGLDTTDCQVLKVYTPQISPKGCSVLQEIDTTSTELTVQNNQNQYLESVYGGAINIRFTLGGSISTPYISPIVDTGLFYGVGAKMIVTNTASTSTSYVSKSVSLPQNLSANGIFAVADVCCRPDSQVVAYVRWSEQGESELFNRSWVQMSAVGGLGSPQYPFAAGSNLSNSEYDFRPTQWAKFNTTATIRAYQIKLVFTTILTGVNKTYSQLPSVRSLRMSSFRTI